MFHFRCNFREDRTVISLDLSFQCKSEFYYNLYFHECVDLTDGKKSISTWKFGGIIIREWSFQGICNRDDLSSLLVERLINSYCAWSCNRGSRWWHFWKRLKWFFIFLVSSFVPLGRLHRRGVLISKLAKVRAKKRPFVSTWRRCSFLLMKWESVMENTFHLLSFSVIFWLVMLLSGLLVRFYYSWFCCGIESCVWNSKRPMYMSNSLCLRYVFGSKAIIITKAIIARDCCHTLSP